MKRIIIPTLLLSFALTGNAQAFIFTDLVAKIQRIAMMGQFAHQIEQMDQYQTEFDKYHTQFRTYKCRTWRSVGSTPENTQNMKTPMMA